MSRSRPSRCLLLAVMLAALAPVGASAQPLSTPSAPACLPTCGSDAYVPQSSRPDRLNPPAAAALAAHRANQKSDSGLAAHRLDLSRQVAAIVHAADSGLAVHRLDLSAPAAEASAQPACLPTCGSASVAPRVTPVSPSALAKANS